MGIAFKTLNNIESLKQYVSKTIEHKINEVFQVLRSFSFFVSKYKTKLEMAHQQKFKPNPVKVGCCLVFLGFFECHLIESSIRFV